jgi:hypothetical protein
LLGSDLAQAARGGFGSGVAVKFGIDVFGPVDSAIAATLRRKRNGHDFAGSGAGGYRRAGIAQRHYDDQR